VLGGRSCEIDNLRPGHMDNLHQGDPRKFPSQFAIDGRIYVIAKLQCVGPATALLRNDFVCESGGGEQKRSDRRRDLLSDFGDGFFSDDARSAGHRRDQS
jgi:hypothetical protein